MTLNEIQAENARKMAKEKGKEFCEARASKGGQAVLQKYGIDVYKALIAKRWSKN